MIDTFAKEYLHGDLRQERRVMLWKLEGLTEYDVRRPPPEHLLGLIKHLSIVEAWYFGVVFGRPTLWTSTRPVRFLGGRVLTSCSSTFLFTCSPRPAGTPGTPTLRTKIERSARAADPAQT